MTRATSFAPALRVAVAAVLAIVFTPVNANAHPRLMRSEPAAAGRLAATAVGMVRLWFNERPEVRLTSLTLTDSSGRAISLGGVEPEPGDPLGVRVRVQGALTPGSYTVSWRTAASDGHPVRGSFSFVVLPGVATASATPDTAHAMADSTVAHREGSTGAGVTYTTVRAFTFVALLMLIGAVAFRFAVLKRARASAALAVAIERRVATLGAVAGVALMVFAVARLLLQMQVFSADLSAGTESLSTADVLSTRWGSAWLVQIGAALVALGGFASASRARLGWSVALVAAIVLAFSSALSGHAGATSNATLIAIVSDAVHVAGASGWMGGLFVLVAVAIPTVVAASSDSECWATVAALVNAFSPMALLFAGFLVLTGAVAAWLHLGSVGALWSSAYGRTLLLKVGALVPLAATGAYNWRVVRPALGTPVATTRLKRSAAVELAVGLVVIAVTAVLVATEPPIQ